MKKIHLDIQREEKCALDWWWRGFAQQISNRNDWLKNGFWPTNHLHHHPAVSVVFDTERKKKVELGERKVKGKWHVENTFGCAEF